MRELKVFRRVRVEIGDTEKERRHRKLWKRKPSVDMAILGQFPQVNSSRPGDAVHAAPRQLSLVR